MIKVAFVKNTGEITQWCSPGDDNQWLDRSMVGDLFVIHMDNSIDMFEFQKVNVWDFSLAEWKQRLPQPNLFYLWQNGQWVLDETNLQRELRLARNSILFSTDWTQANDVPLTTEQKEQWAAYRQELRNLPQNNQTVTSLDQVVWPQPPVGSA
jgi:hypothetical protein